MVIPSDLFGDNTAFGSVRTLLCFGGMGALLEPVLLLRLWSLSLLRRRIVKYGRV